MEKEYIERLIHEYNPQLTGKKTELPAFKRHLYPELIKWIKKKQIMAITGLRRVGKTTLMKQLMEELDNPVFFSFDEEETQTKEVLLFVIDYFINNLKSKCILLDEIQYVRDWQGVLKRHYDTKNIKFIISGSESLELRKAKESLAGRIITFRLEPLNFREYLELRGKEIEIKHMKEDYAKMLTEKEFFEFEFTNYLYCGGFPEIINETDEDIIRKYINELIVKKIIYRDIPQIFEVKRKDLLYALFRYICNNSANLFEIKNLCTTLKADYETITNYLLYLQEAFLVKISEVHAKGVAKRLRRNKKIYITHPSIAFAVLNYKKEMLMEKILGQYVESLFGKDSFWRDKHKNEVDIVLQGRPIEVKYTNNITKEDTKSVLRFMNTFKTKEATIITKNTFKEETTEDKKILYIPAWYYALQPN
ncbi:MAG: ATP-binding protein [Candidatus Altiarchaeales archaeon]|nr:ATP-binding protein [Candidatus Altiarchaeales archaeon]